jgi:capsular polysaccharide biosynthesis protein
MEINIKDYFLMIKKRLWIIVLCVGLSTVLSATYTAINYQPIYLASTKLIVNKTVEKDQMGKEQIDYAAIGINVSLINTYKEIIKTPAIMDKVVQRYPDINMSAEQLINVTNVADLRETQIMTIVAQHYSQEKAVKIVNAVTEVFQSEIPKIMKVDNITILNRAKVLNDPKPVNKQSNSFIILGFAVSFVIAIGIILLLEMLDDTLKTNEDIRTILETSTLAVIPKMKEKALKPATRNTVRKRSGEMPYAKTIH